MATGVGTVQRPVGTRTVLLVEDNEDDVALARRAFRRCQLAEPEVVRDGAEALDYLYRRGAWGDRVSTPGLILLDLKLPKVGGLEVLQTVKRDPALWRIPVIVLTSSRHDADIRAAYTAGVNGYVVKPVAFADFVETIRTLVTFWLHIVEPPPV